MNDRTRKILTPQVLAKQGAYFCTGCNRTPEQLIIDGISPKLYIDHIDNNNDNNDISNLQFHCVSCNTKKNHPQNEENYTDSTPRELIRGRTNIKRARKYVFGIMSTPFSKENPRPRKDLLINDLAEFLDCSQQAVKDYLNKMTSKKHGLYEWQEGMGGFEYLYEKNNNEKDKAVRSTVEQ